ncbi:unnamed protein product [Danaus chrysippus]|uniref:(African queen) hypothetical protein n=1 Tax=Danaus chrysippus TaxID=151541 RepID=A0A8J2VXS9_9NEOP|nr:unnamed protein product [Danaus chrysippus]
METNPLYCIRTGRTISEKTMEDGNITNIQDDKIAAASLANLYSERPSKLTTNGHDFAGESSSSPDQSFGTRCHSTDTLQEDKFRKRINPLKIHLGKRPFVDNSVSYSVNKKRKPFVNKTSDTPKNIPPRVPKSIPKRLENSHYQNVASHSGLESEKDKPVPRLVPKSQLSQYKKGKVEKGAQLKEYAQSLGLQPMVKFKCRKCCSMSFKTLAMLKEHQLVCRAQAKEPALSPEAAPNTEMNSSGPSRVTRKVYLCSACGTYYENWNLFLHMREVHNRHICLFCLGMFSKAEKLSSHLTNKHNVKEFNFDTKEEFSKVYNGTFYLMCCACDEICSEKDDFFNHDCNNVKPKPVPVLISKNSMKTNSKICKSSNETSQNGPGVVNKDAKSVHSKKIINEPKPDKQTTHLQRPMSFMNNDSMNTDTNIRSNSSIAASKETSIQLDSSNENNNITESSTISSVENLSNNTTESITPSVPNGNEPSDESEDSDTPESLSPEAPVPDSTSLRPREPTPPPVEKEKEGGIKLKLSLNNANSPVIINSTVDPTVGQQYAHKPPSRNRRPPKRYEKDKPPDPAPPSKPPLIKMTICDKADSSFVKTTVIENNKETVTKTLVNNNVESICKPPEQKTETAIKSTIYDNKLEDLNTLNRVPKLTVRVPKEFLDKDSSSDYSSDSDSGEKCNGESKESVEEPCPEMEEPKREVTPTICDYVKKEETTENENIQEPPVDENVKNEDQTLVQAEPKVEEAEQTAPDEINVEEPDESDNVPVTELTLDRPIDKYPLKDLLKVFLASTVINCIYCNHARKIAVNCEQLALHMVAEHRFSATVNSITAEELMPETITAKVKAGAPELCTVYINLDSYDSVDKCETVQNNQLFECFQCYFRTAVHKDLYLHNRKMHQKTILLCVMCKNNFYSYSELLCHLCPGTYDSEYEIKFRCCFCNVDNILSTFRLMVHLRKIHHTCDVCLEFCQSQARLSNHVWKHKLHHLCYRCGIAYRNKPDITNHLFWKHGTESVLCKRCLQKKWPHVYHFCTPPAVFVCDECTLQFTRAVCLKVHKRFHSAEFPHVCIEEGCTEKFVSKKLLNKHLEEHGKKLVKEELKDSKPLESNDAPTEDQKDPIPVIDLVNDKPKEEAGSSDVKAEAETELSSKKVKKKKVKDKDALLLDVNLPALNLSESDSDDSDSNSIQPTKEIDSEDKPKLEPVEDNAVHPVNNDKDATDGTVDISSNKVEETPESLDDKTNEQQVLDIWDNFKKYQAKVEKQKEKTPPLVPIRKHVCESDHDYCVIPTEVNGDEESFDKRKNKKSPKKKHGGLSSSSSSSSDSDSSCSCGSNCSCSSSSGSSSSSSSDSDSSDESGNEKKKNKQLKKSLPNRRMSNGSNVDVMGMSETPILVPEKTEPAIAESDLETDESETDEEFYDKNPQQIANKLHNEKRNQLLLLASVAPSDGGSVSGDVSRCNTPVKEEEPQQPKEEVKDEDNKETEVKQESEVKDKSSGKKKSKKKKKSRSSRKHGPLKMIIPKDVITKPEEEIPPPLIPNKITISLQSNTVQLPETPKVASIPPPKNSSTPATTVERKRASKRRRVPNRFYGYSSDEEAPQTPAALKPQLPPKLEWRKEDLPSPVTHKPKKEIPSTVTPQRMFNYTEPIRLTAPIPDPEPPRFLMNSESMESSDSESSTEPALEIFQPPAPNPPAVTVPPPTYLNSGTSSLPYAFQRPAARQAREGESVYCYCRCPYDEVSEMIACDADGCPIEWFHFECVGIMVPPKGKWYCPECRKNQSVTGR